MDMKITFYSHANRTRFQRKGFALGLVLTGRVFGTQKWPIKLIGRVIANVIFH